MNLRPDSHIEEHFATIVVYEGTDGTEGTYPTLVAVVAIDLSTSVCVTFLSLLPISINYSRRKGMAETSCPDECTSASLQNDGKPQCLNSNQIQDVK